MAMPSARQLEWADMELGVIIHHLMDIYNPDYKGFKTRGVRTHMPPEIFAPMQLDTDQWLAAAQAAGARYAVLVANHCTGFSLWPTRVNDYSVARSPWRGGRGDIVRDFVDSCARYGLKPGLYYSTGCNGYYDINDEVVRPGTPEYDAYARIVERQLTELWTQYGELFEIWFDGGTIPVELGGPDAAALLERYQPGAICFQGPPGHAHNVRWVGNERGLAPENCWSATDYGEDAYEGVDTSRAGEGDPDGRHWWPAECDMGNRRQDAFGGGWGWRAGEQDKAYTPQELLDCYCRSVGRNANLLLGMAINRDGLFEDAAQFEAFGALLRRTFGRALAECAGEGLRVELELPDAPLNYVVIQEDQARGHAVRGFRVLLDGRELYAGECIGHKRILPVAGARGRTLALEVTRAAARPAIRRLAAY